MELQRDWRSDIDREWKRIAVYETVVTKNNATGSRCTAKQMRSSGAVLRVLLLAFVLGATAVVTSVVSGVAATDNPYLFLPDPAARNVVVEYTGKDEDEHRIMRSMQPRIVELYNPYCGHCQMFKATYIDVARAVRRDRLDEELAFYGVSCVAHDALCRSFDYNELPTIFAVVTDDIQRRVEIPTTQFTAESVERALQEARTMATGGGVAAAKPASRRLDEGDEEGPEGNLVDETGARRGKDNESEDSSEAERDSTDSDSSGAQSNESEGEDTGQGEDEQEGGGDNEETEGNDDQSEGGEDEQSEESEETDQSDEGGDGDNEASSGTDVDGEGDQEEDRPGDRVPPVRPKPGAAAAKLLPSDMDRWKRIRIEQLAEQKRIQDIRKRAREDTEDSRDGPTKMMRAHIVNTDEFAERKRKYIEFMMKLQKKRKDMVFDAKSIPAGKIGELGFQKNVRGPRVVEKLPVVRQITKLSDEEELILDCTLAIFHGLSYDVFRSNYPLPSDKKSALSDWLDLMKVSLPPEWAVTSLVSALRLQIDTISRSVENMNALIFKYRFRRTKFSSSCRKSRSPLGCAYWRLFHVMTVGIAQHRGGLNLVESGMRGSYTRVFSPLEAADTLHNYVRLFFYCGECSKNFVADYEDCDKNRRCSRLADNALTATDDDWKELAKWLWEIHNDVSVRLLNEAADRYRKTRQQRLFLGAGAGPGAALEPDQIQALWPDIRQCVSCFNGDGSWNENAVFRHLEKTYWFDLDFDTVNTGLIWVDGEMIHSPRLTLFLLFIGVVLLGLMIHSLRMPVLTRTVLLANRKLGTPRVSLFPKKERTV